MARLIKDFDPASFSFNPLDILISIAPRPLTILAMNKLDPGRREQRPNAVALVVGQRAVHGLKLERWVPLLMIFKGKGLIEPMIVNGFYTKAQTRLPVVNEITPERPEICVC